MMPAHTNGQMDHLNAIMLIEEGNPSMAEYLEAWSVLIASGVVWSLQGFYGRNATNLIEQGIIDRNGKVLVSTEEAEDLLG